MVVNYEISSAHYEHFLFWHHLQLAGLISGNYTGVRGPDATTHHVIGENSPRAKFGNGGWSAWSYGGSHIAYFTLDYGNMIFIGAAGSGRPVSSLFTPEEAWNIDTKIDDGKPGQGNVIARNWDNACANAGSQTDYDADYRVADTSARCVLFFRKAF